MTPPDDLKPGMYVAVVHEDYDEPPAQHWSYQPSGRWVYSGDPLKILAVSLPFVGVTNGEERYSLDMREVKVQKLSLAYVRAMAPELTFRNLAESVEAKPVKLDSRYCQQCGCRLTEMLKLGVWSTRCPDCGLVVPKKEAAK